MFPTHRLLNRGIASCAAAFILAASAGQAQTTRETAAVTLPNSLPTASAYTTEDAFGPGLKFAQPVCIATPPGEQDRFFISEKKSGIQLVKRKGTAFEKSTFLDVSAMLMAKNEGKVMSDSEMGVLGIAFHPDFAKNGYFFVTYSLGVMENGKLMSFERLSRFSVSKKDPDVADPDSEVPMITQLDLASNHNGGDIHFGPDGYLYYSIGDEGAQRDYYDNARFIDKDFFASILRLDVDGKPGSLTPNPHTQKSITFPSAVSPGAYKVPADNPFVSATTHNGAPVDVARLRTEIWACGFRNPWRFSFDPKTNEMYIGDVGQDRWEEVDIGKAGANYGWSFWEGTHPGPRNKALPQGVDFTPPIYEYPHGPGSVFNGISIIGGVVYRGSRLPELDGTYIFGDYGTLHIWGLQQVGTKWVPSLINTFGDVDAFGVDPTNGDVLIAEMGGRVGRLVRKPKSNVEPPARLSKTGVFNDVAALTPAAGIVPYAPIVNGWNGHVATRRWFGIPNADAIKWDAIGSWEFPAGTFWVQELDHETKTGDPDSGKKIETRLLVKTEDGAYGLTYKWRADQKDADLVAEGGETGPFLTGSQTYHYPARAECAMCHSAAGGYALGFDTWNLNRASLQDPQVNQVRALFNAGYLKEPPHRGPEPAWPAYAAFGDGKQPIESQVRAYLSVNCAGCHQPGGLGLGFWDGRATTPMAETKIVGGPLVTNFGDAASRFVVAGDPLHSMIVRRLKGDGVPKMPMASVPDVDADAVAAITKWIQSLPPSQ